MELLKPLGIILEELSILLNCLSFFLISPELVTKIRQDNGEWLRILGRRFEQGIEQWWSRIELLILKLLVYVISPVLILLLVLSLVISPVKSEAETPIFLAILSLGYALWVIGYRKPKEFWRDWDRKNRGKAMVAFIVSGLGPVLGIISLCTWVPSLVIEVWKTQDELVLFWILSQAVLLVPIIILSAPLYEMMEPLNSVETFIWMLTVIVWEIMSVIILVKFRVLLGTWKTTALWVFMIATMLWMLANVIENFAPLLLRKLADNKNVRRWFLIIGVTFFFIGSLCQCISVPLN